jgi:hypothetical protein
MSSAASAAMALMGATSSLIDAFGQYTFLRRLPPHYFCSSA